jgi:hypothetical protein
MSFDTGTKALLQLSRAGFGFAAASEVASEKERLGKHLSRVCAGSPLMRRLLSRGAVESRELLPSWLTLETNRVSVLTPTL